MKKIDFSNIGQEIVHITLDKNKEQDVEDISIGK